MVSDPSTLLWGGRFTENMNDLMVTFNESLPFDKALHEADVRGSITYAKALLQLDLLTDEELSEITTGLEAVEKEWADGKFVIHPAIDEDIHTANERRLAELIGPTIAGKLHTGRSRNEQIATDLRLWVRAQLDGLSEQLRAALTVCAARAKAEVDVLMPGYTHFQRAQPVRSPHWLLSHATYLMGDLQRLHGVRDRTNCCPLGVGALAGNPFGIDRTFLTNDLDFSSVHPNSLAAVGDRDFVAEILQWSSLLMVHLSRLSEDLILYSTAEFSFNPDSLELIRGKAGRVMGQASGFLSTLKSLPTAYNKDIQESVEPLLDCVKTVSHCLRIAGGVLSTLQIDSEKMKAALTADMLATDVADYLVLKGVPFRQTHHIAGAVVRKAEEKGIYIAELELPDLKQISPQFEADIVDVFDFERSVERRTAQGGTSRSSVLGQISAIEAYLAGN
ncbi:hypothetical protein FoTM2_007265 [Fusarium oxysporum f. sp. vasinfectum]|uniref:argininosuccinate lyase n=1 Tax=Fusarium oxysporum f. sp. vasinfectum 25433 TaxID=1089449 RepID=X0M0W1_FUSOX|nr:argininosuccinate lyase [Fusarium oxysporum f. sp. vasinfectum 25433]KAK2932806.1 hypothetical protein FoTM2_007265 [Fusarium oxysporum f. sp. vasinfectum]